MTFSFVQIFFYLVATYTAQLDVCKLLIEKHLAQKQDKQLREYFENSGDGIVIFRNESDLGDGQQLRAETPQFSNGEVLLSNKALARLLGVKSQDGNFCLTNDQINEKFFFASKSKPTELVREKQQVKIQDPSTSSQFQSETQEKFESLVEVLLAF